MELAEVLRRRRMVRRYDPGRDVPAKLLDRILAAALRAPSAGNSQGSDLLVLRSAVERGQFWDACTEPAAPEDSWLTGMRGAPVLVLCLADPPAYRERYAEPDKAGVGRAGQDFEVPWWDVDTGMAALLLLLAAVDEGLGACLFGVPTPAHPALRAAFGIPASHRFVAAVTVGYRAGDEASRPTRRRRRALREAVHDGSFGRSWTPTAGG